MTDEIKQKVCDLMSTIKKVMPFFNKNTGEARFGLRHGLHDKDASFAIIAVRCDDKHCTGRKNLIPGKIYQLLNGYSITEKTINVDSERKALNLLYDDYNPENTNAVPHVQFSAIVGKNGSGKSSLVELMMRIINNFSTKLYGEVNSDPAANRLHYIDHVMATMWFALEGCIYQLTVKYQQVALYTFEKHNESEDRIEYQLSKANPLLIGDEVPSSDEPISGICDNAVIQKIAEHFFYTLVSNYAIYAYNTNDFKQESFKTRKEEGANVTDEDDDDYDKEVWLYSLFHKNDGYKVPIGITPFRRQGNIDVNNEKELANERLISLMVRNPDYRVINKHLTVDGINLFDIQLDFWGYDQVKKVLHFKNMTIDGYKELRDTILSKWEEYTGVYFTKNKTKPCYNEALNYIVYKTLKVSKQYGEHHEFYKLLDLADNFPTDTVAELVKGESDNHSHVTRKIFQTIAYLVYDVYDLSYSEKATGKIYNSFDDILQRWDAKERRLKEGEYTRNKVHVWNSAMFPPPFLEFELKIHAIESDEPVKFESLSSGERQQLFTISSLLYHLDNLNSIKDDEYDKDRVFYPHVTIVLEEIELYFHPEMQQSFVRYLMDGILSINLEHLKSVHFILVTHSPYVLSDIPRANILALNEKSDSVDVASLKAFGANIHDMLRKSFFLGNGAIGSYAQWEIKHIAACLNIHRWAKQPDVDYTNYNEILENESYEFIERYTTTTNQDAKRRYFEYGWFQEELGPKQLKQKIDLIDEPVLHNALMHQYCDVFGVAVASKEEKRQRLLQQLKQLDEDDTI